MLGLGMVVGEEGEEALGGLVALVGDDGGQDEAAAVSWGVRWLDRGEFGFHQWQIPTAPDVGRQSSVGTVWMTAAWLPVPPCEMRFAAGIAKPDGQVIVGHFVGSITLGVSFPRDGDDGGEQSVNFDQIPALVHGRSHSSHLALHNPLYATPIRPVSSGKFGRMGVAMQGGES